MGHYGRGSTELQFCQSVRILQTACAGAHPTLSTLSMRDTLVLSTVLTAVIMSCAPGAEVVPPSTPEAPMMEAPPAQAAPAKAAPAKAPPLTAEEQKAAAEKEKLARDFATLEEDHKSELNRLTPELRASLKPLAEKTYPSTRAALKAALAGAQRKPGHAARDAQRHPRETLEFFGLKPNQNVLEVGPGEGWYTELLAPTLAKNGKLFVTQFDPNGSKDQRPTLYGLRTKYFLEELPEVYRKVEPVVVDMAAPKFSLDGKLDSVLLIRGAHGLVNNKLLTPWLAEFHRALKARGILGIEQHRAAAGKSADETSQHGYLPEAFVIEQVEAAGFKLAAKSEINANPKDTKNYPEGVWSLPPTLREGEKDRDKYMGIGESDRMTLRFVKVEAAGSAKTPAK